MKLFMKIFLLPPTGLEHKNKAWDNYSITGREIWRWNKKHSPPIYYFNN